MAKTYLSTVKYNIVCSFEINGLVDKHDVIGAIFGQSEGLLGEEMDLRELQKNGKIGRIEIIPEQAEGKTKGKLIVPSSLDMVQTSLLAAAIESIDKVGPYESKFATEQIEDTRTNKRKEIKDRAKELLQKFLHEQMPATQELEEEVRENVRTEELQFYGPEKLPCGPDIEKEESIIIVEGRADVLNLLRNNIKNVIGINGSKIPETIIDLCRRKTVTLFADGDRGGELIQRQLMQLTKIDFLARAPDGKEVEELTRKELVMALKKKIPSSLAFRQPEGMERERPFRRSFRRPPLREKGFGRPRGRFSPGRRSFGPGRGRRPVGRFGQPFRPFEEPIEKELPVSEEDRALFEPKIKELKGSLEAVLLDQSNNEITRVKVRDLLTSLKEYNNVNSIVFDGIVTKRLAEEARTLGIKNLVGIRKGRIGTVEGVKVIIIRE
ncbi:MAG: DNA primase DnaG [Candidatus Diapherotrites archaeon]